MTNPSIFNELLHKENIYNKWKKLLSVLRMYNVFMKIYIHYKPDIIV